MRTFRQTAGVVIVVAIAAAPFVHLLAFGAVLGLALCTGLWWSELRTWAQRSWRALWEAIAASRP